jgi:hypothetical protein
VTYAVIETTTHMGERVVESGLTAAEAVREYDVVEGMWQWDDRFESVEIRDEAGRRFRPTPSGSMLGGHVLPLIAEGEAGPALRALAAQADREWLGGGAEWDDRS